MNMKLKQMCIAMLLAGSLCSNVLAAPAALLATIGLSQDMASKDGFWKRTHVKCPRLSDDEDMFIRAWWTDDQGKDHEVTVPLRDLAYNLNGENVKKLAGHLHIRSIFYGQVGAENVASLEVNLEKCRRSDLDSGDVTAISCENKVEYRIFKKDILQVACREAKQKAAEESPSK